MAWRSGHDEAGELGSGQSLTADSDGLWWNVAGWSGDSDCSCFFPFFLPFLLGLGECTALVLLIWFLN